MLYYLWRGKLPQLFLPAISHNKQFFPVKLVAFQPVINTTDFLHRKRNNFNFWYHSLYSKHDFIQLPSSMLTIMCEKPSLTKRTDLPEVPGPTLRSRNLRYTRPLGTIRHLENHSSKSIFYSQRALAKPSSYAGHTRGKEIIPRVEGKSPIVSNPNMQRKILSASFPKSVDTVPLKNEVTLVKSNLAVGRLAGSQHRFGMGVTRNRSTHSAWSKHAHYKHVTKPLVTTPRTKDKGNERTSLKEFDDMVSKNYEPDTDHSTQNGNMGYREKCLHWLLTLPD